MQKKTENVLNELRPPIEVSEKGSGFKIKDQFFTKTKGYIDKKDGRYKEVDADWRSLNIGGIQMNVAKGVELTKDQYAAFNDEAKKYWLDKASKRNTGEVEK